MINDKIEEIEKILGRSINIEDQESSENSSDSSSHNKFTNEINLNMPDLALEKSDSNLEVLGNSEIRDKKASVSSTSSHN